MNLEQNFGMKVGQIVARCRCASFWGSTNKDMTPRYQAHVIPENTRIIFDASNNMVLGAST